MKHLFLGILFSFLFNPSVFAMGRGAPAQPMPAGCAVKDYIVIGKVSRKMETSYETVPGGCVQQCAGSVCQDYFCVPTSCRQVDKTVSIPDNEVLSQCREFKNGYSLMEADRLVCDLSAPWTTTAQGGNPPSCNPTIKSQTVEARYPLSSEEFKHAQCEQLYTCMAQMTSEDDLLLVKQWQNHYDCSHVSQ